VNPFLLARLELRSTQPAERALAALDRLLAEGFEAGGRRYRLFGRRRGGRVAMSLGLPLVGGAAPVLHARLRAASGPACFDLWVRARLELIVLGLSAVLLTAVGGATQLVLQLRAVAEGRAGWGDVTDVLPGLAVVSVLVGLGLLHLRRRGTRDAALLLGAFRDAIGAVAPGGATPDALPFA